MLAIFLIASLVAVPSFAGTSDSLSETRARLEAAVDAVTRSSDALRAREAASDASGALHEYVTAARQLEEDVRVAREAYQDEIEKLSQQANEAVTDMPRKAEDLTGRMKRLLQEMLSLTIRPALLATAARLDAVRLLNTAAQSRPLSAAEHKLRAESLDHIKGALDETLASINHPDNRLLLAPYTADAYRQLGYWALFRRDVKTARDAFAQAYLYKASEGVRHATEALDKIDTRRVSESEHVLSRIATASLTAESPGTTILLTAIEETRDRR